jgi:hypothetical protein
MTNRMQGLLAIVSGRDQVSAPKERRGAEGSALLRARDHEFPHFGLSVVRFIPRRVVSSVSMPARNVFRRLQLSNGIMEQNPLSFSIDVRVLAA